MKITGKKLTAIAVLLFGVVSVAQASKPSDLFIVRSTTKSPDAVVGSLKSYAKSHRWLFVGATKVRKGTVTLVKVCIPKVGRKVWPQGLYLSAMLPCGNVGVYRKAGKTEVSMLDARYLHVLVPTPAMKKISAMAEPMLMGMLNTALK